MNLFNIEAKYLQLMNQVEEAEGELTPELIEELTINREELESKLLAYHYVIATAKGEMKVIEDEIDRLKKLAEVKNNLIDRLKERMLEAVLLFGEDGKSGNKKLDLGTLKMYTVNKKVVHLDEDKVSRNTDYLNVTITKGFSYQDYNKIKEFIPDVEPNITISKTKVKEALEEGTEVPGAMLVTKPYLTIK